MPVCTRRPSRPLCPRKPNLSGRLVSRDCLCPLVQTASHSGQRVHRLFSRRSG
jgi:hypothetical protein